jgi:hypothetical protein
VFLTLMLTALRNSAVRELRWRGVDLDSVLRARDSKSDDGIRSIAISPMLAEALWQHRDEGRPVVDAATRIYLHLAGRTFYPSEPTSDDLASPAMIRQEASAG